MPYRFPIATKAWSLAKRARRNWLDRHRNAFNFWIHLVGIPLALTSLPLFFLVDWPWAVSALTVGYALQWLGHRVEGNDVGEIIPLKKLFGIPFVAIAPTNRPAAVPCGDGLGTPQGL